MYIPRGRRERQGGKEIRRAPAHDRCGAESAADRVNDPALRRRAARRPQATAVFNVTSRTHDGRAAVRVSEPTDRQTTEFIATADIIQRPLSSVYTARTTVHCLRRSPSSCVNTTCSLPTAALHYPLHCSFVFVCVFFHYCHVMFHLNYRPWWPVLIGMCLTGSLPLLLHDGYIIECYVCGK